MSIHSQIAGAGRNGGNLYDSYVRGKTNRSNLETAKMNQNKLSMSIDQFKESAKEKSDAKKLYPIIRTARQLATPQAAREYIAQSDLSFMAEEDQQAIVDMIQTDDATFQASLASAIEKISALSGITPSKKEKAAEKFGTYEKIPGTEFYGQKGDQSGKYANVKQLKNGSSGGGKGGDSDLVGGVKPGEYRQVRKGMKNYIDAVYDGQWDPQREEFRLKDVKARKEAAAVDREATKIWRNKYNNEYDKAIDAAQEAMVKFNIDLPDTPEATPPDAQGQNSVSNWAAKMYPGR